MEKKLLGRWGEGLVAAEYRRRGYRVVDANAHSRFGEIDLILEKKNVTVFCEVKLRKDARFAAPREWVDRAKQQKIIKTALLWLAAHRGHECAMRFDVAEVYAPDGWQTARPTVEIIEDAFGG